MQMMGTEVVNFRCGADLSLRITARKAPLPYRLNSDDLPSTSQGTGVANHTSLPEVSYRWRFVPWSWNNHRRIRISRFCRRCCWPAGSGTCRLVTRIAIVEVVTQNFEKIEGFVRRKPAQGNTGAGDEIAATLECYFQGDGARFSSLNRRLSGSPAGMPFRRRTSRASWP